MIPSDRLIVALDFSEREKLRNFYRNIQGLNIWVKIGMEAFYSCGPDIIHGAKDHGLKIFLDLKLHDIPNTVEKSIKALCKLPIDMVNVHAAGGSEMMRKAAEAVKTSPHSPLLIAVTQLTSTSTEQMNQEQRIPGEILNSVLHYARLAKESGCDGVVSSPLEVQEIKRLCGKSFLTVTPGIRPLSSDHEDQKRVTTPEEALRLGTDFLVIGRPITGAHNPQQAILHLLQGNSP